MAETTSSEQTDNPAFWCVGLGGGPEEDKEKTLERFISQNIWENLGDNEGLAETVNKVRAGDRLAIRTTHKRKDDLPFDSRGFYVSTVLVRAVGTVTDNPEDSHTLHVNWERCDPYREWLFFSHTPNIWQPETSNPHAARFVDFCLKKEAQDINWFRNRDYWSWRYGDDPRFAWSGFYTQFADRLLTFRDRRDELGTMLRELASGPESFPALQALVQRVPGDLLSDVSPFSVMALFNCQDSADERTRAARVLANRIGVTEPVPTVFAGVSVLTEPACLDAAIAEDGTVSSVGADALWELFAVSLAYRWLPDGGSWLQFVSVFDNALRHCRAGWNLPQALSWGRPWKYPALDETSRLHIAKKYGETIVSQQECCTGKQYLELRERLLKRFNEYKNSVHWFPALFLEAGQIQPAPRPEPRPTPVPYTVENILKDGCFISQDRLEAMLESLQRKKNLILQGPPGTGKTWLAKRLGYAVAGHKDKSLVRSLQFHPNMSYEDFVRGWRPCGDGRLALVDGPFMEAIDRAKAQPDANHVLVIEEINRGNPALIFGEMLTLLEADKRREDEALELAYKKESGERVWIPDNLHVIGTMNIADRSLAMVDLALRRRFAFVDLKPELGTPWGDWLGERGFDKGLIAQIRDRMTDLNRTIEQDKGLGPQYRVGHSYVTPPADAKIADPAAWFRRVVETEITPLLEEYWYDSPDRAKDAADKLLEGLIQ